jgi:hypothetical protein
MIIKTIRQFVETQTTILQKKAGTYKVECTVDDEVVPCDTFTDPYISVPAPIILENDPWFGEPVHTEKALDKKREIDHNKKVEAESSVESPDIHQEMYELATKNWTTVKETDGWQSGTGYNQFRP